MADDALRRQPVRGDEQTERLPLDVLHDDKGLAVLIADFVDGADVGMGERKDGNQQNGADIREMIKALQAIQAIQPLPLQLQQGQLRGDNLKGWAP